MILSFEDEKYPHNVFTTNIQLELNLTSFISLKISFKSNWKLENNEKELKIDCCIVVFMASHLYYQNVTSSVV